MAQNYENITALDQEALELLDNQTDNESEEDIVIEEEDNDTDTTETDGETNESEDTISENETVTPQNNGVFQIDGLGEVTLDQIKEWKNGYLRQSDYTKKTQEVARQRNEASDALEVYNYLKNNPQLVEGLKSVGNEYTNSVVNKATYENQELQDIKRKQIALEVDMQLRNLKDTYGEFDEVALLNKASDMQTEDLETVLKAMKYENTGNDIASLREQLKNEILAEMKRDSNKEKVGTIVSEKNKAPSKKGISLSADERRVADAMGMSYTEYAKWK